MELIEVLKKVEIFEYCHETELEAAFLHMNKRFFEAYSMVGRQGETSTGLHILVRGAIRIIYNHKDGRELVLAILQPYQTVGEMSLLDEERYSATIETLEPTEFLILSRESFLKVFEKVPGIALGIMRSLSRRLRKCDEALADMAYMPPAHRLAKKLLELQKGNVLELTHQELAMLVGATRETVTRTLNAFEEMGYVRNNRKQIRILNASALQAISSGSSP